MNRKYFFFDIDGTLIPGSGNKYIPENTKAAIDKLKGEGHFLAIATGRGRCLAMDQCKSIGFDSMISDGGNGVMIEGKMEDIIPLDKSACLALIKECEEKNLPWGYSQEDDPVRLTFYEEFKEKSDDFYQTAKVIPAIPPETIPQFIKMFVVCNEEEEKSIIALNKLPHTRYGPVYNFVEPVDKSAGIRRVMEHFGAKDEDVVVFGDGFNDISMFRPEWTSVAMGNAVPELKEKASFITKNCEDDGIIYALKHYGWI